MQTLPIIPEIMSLSQLRYDTSRLLKKLLKDKEPVLMMRRSEEIGIVLPIKMYKKMIKEAVPYRIYSDEEIKTFLKEDKLSKKLGKKVRSLWKDLS